MLGSETTEKKMTKLYTLLEEKARNLAVKAFHTLPIKTRGTFLFCCFVSPEDEACSVIFSPLQGFHCNGSIGLDTGYPMNSNRNYNIVY